MIDYTTTNRSLIADQRLTNPDLTPGPGMPWIEKLSPFSTMGV
jgi:hypothetical protein